jgi:hypothetical protein
MDEIEARLRIKRRMLLERIGGVGEFLRGSVVLMKRRCTYPRCRRCAAGTLHPTWVLTASHKGKTRTTYLGAGRLDDARRMTQNYRRLMALIEQAAEVNRQLLTGRKSLLKGSPDASGQRRGQSP